MNIFVRELRANLKALLLWCLGFVLMVSMGMGKFTGLDGSGQEMRDLMDQVPVMKAMLGGNFDISTALGFFCVLFLYLLLMASIHGAMLGTSIVSKEERDRTSEFLYVKPVSRHVILTAKLLSSLVNIIVINLVTLFISQAMVAVYAHGIDVSREINILMLGLFLVQVIFLTFGLFCAVLTKKPKLAPALSTGILLMTFFLSMAIDLNGKLGLFRIFTPFKYFDANTLLNVNGFDPFYVVLTVILTLVFMVVSYLRFSKRDFSI